MRLWVDDCRTPPTEGEWIWLKTINGTIDFLNRFKGMNMIELISLDHDAGDFAKDGGDYIRILDWMEANDYDNIIIHIHSRNPVGVANMNRICEKNGWIVI